MCRDISVLNHLDILSRKFSCESKMNVSACVQSFQMLTLQTKYQSLISGGNLSTFLYWFILVLKNVLLTNLDFIVNSLNWTAHNSMPTWISIKNNGRNACPVFIFGTACQIYCYGRYCVRRSVSPQVPKNPSGPLVDNFIVLPCVAFGVACVKLLPGVDRWNSLDDPRVIGPCHCEVWGWPRH